MWKSRRHIALALLVLALLSHALAQAPTPHGVAGFIFNSVGSAQVAAGTAYRVNESVSNDMHYGLTGAGPFTGRYSVSLDGTDGDYVVIESWNSSSYGIADVTLQGDMDNINFNLSGTRAGESNITILFPANGTMYEVGDSFNVTLNTTIIGGASAFNCVSHISWTNVTKANFTRNDTNNHTLGAIGLGATSQTVWNLSAKHFGIVNFTVYTSCSSDTINLEHQDQRPFYVRFNDTRPPAPFLISPGNNTANTSTRTINYYFRADDESPLQCTLTIDGIANMTNYSVVPGVVSRITAVTPLGLHQWAVNCTDEAGNRNGSAPFLIDIAIPEFRVFAQNLSFFPPNPTENQTVVINATLFNAGTNASLVAVDFVRNGTVSELIQTVIIDLFPGNSSVIVNASFRASVGENLITVRVDPLDTYNESDESDNSANASFLVSAWQYYVGNTSGRFEIANLLNISILHWETSVRNIFVVEAGADIGWPALHPLGRTLSNATQIDDFVELDAAFGTTNYSDSINRTYTSGGLVRQEYTFIIFNDTIQSVPVVNSTNASSFRTGILWDSSDGGASFNASQDVVFVTQSNRSQTGGYGTYDYELRVPPGLKDYRIVALNQLTFYIELS